MEGSKEKPDLSALRISREDGFESRGRKRAIRNLLWVGIPAIVIIALIVILSGISSIKEVRTGAVMLLTRAQAQTSLSATGYVVAERKASVASKGTGRLEYLAVEEGDEVKKGQVIGRLENSDIAASLDLAKANLEQARAESAEATLEYNRQSQLLATGSTTRAAFETSQARYLSSVAAVKSAQAAVKSVEVAFENTYIRAPFDGTVLTKHADVGEIVAPFASSASSRASIVDLADMSSLEVEADVSESNIQKVIVGQACEIILDAYPSVRYEGYVKKIVPTADRSRATVMTKVAFNNVDKNVLPEMSARINFLQANTPPTIQNDSTVTVPNAALVTKGGQQFVFVVDNNRAVELLVTPGRKLGNVSEILKGVTPGQKVVLSPASNVKNGDKIKVIE